STDVRKTSARQNLADRLHRDFKDSKVRVRVEGGVERAVRVETRHVVAGHAQNAAKGAADEDLAVRLHGGGENKVTEDAEIERLVEPAVAFQTGDTVARNRPAAVRRERVRQVGFGIDAGDAVDRLASVAVHPAETAAHQNLAVRLHRDCVDLIVRVRVERISRSGGGIEPSDTVARLSTDVRKTSARQNLAVRLHRNCKDNIVRVRIERISRAGGGIKPGDVVARLSADA